MSTTVVHLIGSLNRGGAETVALDLCKAIPSSDVLQLFVCLSGQEGSLAEDFKSAGARTVALPVRRPVKFAFALYRLLRAERPNAVVSHVSVASGFLLGIVRAANIKVRISRIHSHGDEHGGGPFRQAYRFIGRLLVALNSTHVLGVSEPSVEFGIGAFRWLARVRGVRVGVLPNGVDMEKFRPPTVVDRPNDVQNVLYVGRAAPEKNRSALVPIYQALTKTRATNWMIVGPGGSADLGPLPTSGFAVLGERNDVADLLRESDALILTSLREGLPGVVLEALACGVPVVLSDLPGMASLAETLEGITLVAPDMSSDQWALALNDALSRTPSDRARIRKCMEDSEFTLDKSATNWASLWRLNAK